MILSDTEIMRAIRSKRLVVNPFHKDSLTPNGLDLHLGNQIAILKRGSQYGSQKIILRSKLRVDPDTVLVATTKESLKTGRDLIATINLRSTYSRLGFSTPTTIVDAGSAGRPTIQLRTPPYPIILKLGEGIWYALFMDTYKTSRPYSGLYKGSYRLVEGNLKK